MYGCQLGAVMKDLNCLLLRRHIASHCHDKGQFQLHIYWGKKQGGLNTAQGGGWSTQNS